MKFAYFIFYAKFTKKSQNAQNVKHKITFCHFEAFLTLFEKNKNKIISKSYFENF